MLYSLLITLREGLEASLIIGIILAYLVQTGHRDRFRFIWAGTAAALGLSLAVGIGLYVTIGGLSGAVMEVIEGTAMFMAVGVLTYMLFWMKKQSVNIKKHLHAQVDSALSHGSSLALAFLAFLVVIREGVETVLFLLGGTFSTSEVFLYWAGAVGGLVLAVGLGYSLYKGNSRLSLRTFFNVTSAMIIVLAAGLLANGIKEFHEVMWIPPVIPNVWDTYHIIRDNSVAGRLLSAVLGYDSSPSLVQVAAFLGYLVGGLLFYFQPFRLRTRLQPSHNTGD